MTRYEVRFTVGDASAAAPLTVVDGHGSLTGALIIPGDEPSIREFTEQTGELLARRHDYGPEIPEAARGSNVEHDLGHARKSIMTFAPEKGSTPAQLDEFLASCKEAGVVGDVALHPEMHRFMEPVKFKVLCELYVPVIRRHGYRHLLIVTNYATVMKDALARFWPGDDQVDAVGVSFYSSGLSLEAAARFCDAHGKPFGLADFGVLHHHIRKHVDDELAFLTYIEAFFAGRMRNGLPCGDLIWVNGHRDGDYRFTLVPEFVDVYRSMRETLAT